MSTWAANIGDVPVGEHTSLDVQGRRPARSETLSAREHAAQYAWVRGIEAPASPLSTGRPLGVHQPQRHGTTCRGRHAGSSVAVGHSHCGCARVICVAAPCAWPGATGRGLWSISLSGRARCPLGGRVDLSAATLQGLGGLVSCGGRFVLQRGMRLSKPEPSKSWVATRVDLSSVMCPERSDTPSSDGAGEAAAQTAETVAGAAELAREVRSHKMRRSSPCLRPRASRGRVA